MDIKNIQQKILEIQEKGKLSVEDIDRNTYASLIKNHALIDKKTIQDYTKNKHLTEKIYERLNQDLKEICLLNSGSHIIMIGENFDFVDESSIFSEVLNQKVFISKKRLIHFLINPKCIHSAKKEEAYLIIDKAIKSSEIPRISSEYVYDLLSYKN